ncbi:uncharacterized protein [Bactrocera oleae]|uniref:uncharacterized protein n=1 Tax=Bactrocera oleae TaxID=104688 RepID=UPI00387E6A0F
MTAIRTKIYDHNVVEEFNYTLVPFQGHYAISSRVIYKIDINNVLLLLTFDLGRDGQPPYRMLKKKIDMCIFLEGSYKYMPIANTVLKKLKKIKNFPKSCPLKASQPLILESFVVSWQQLPVYLPNMSFTVTAVFSTNGKKFSEIIVNGVTSQN